MENYVFNIGFNKSGSSSLSAALNMLGIPTLQHEYKDYQNNITLISSIIEENKKNNRKLFYGLDETYCGFSDFRGEEYFRELYAQYPDSKFILTIRPLEDWLKSVERWQSKKRLFRGIANATKNNNIEKARYYRDQLNAPFNKKHKIKYYRNYKKQIRDFFKDKPDQFLELRICEGEGWPELCSFLNLDQPSVDFPRRNVNIF